VDGIPHSPAIGFRISVDTVLLVHIGFHQTLLQFSPVAIHTVKPELINVPALTKDQVTTNVREV
jgi:hypothetical protein